MEPPLKKIWAHFFPGGFIHKSGPHKASNFYYAALQYTF